MRHVCTPGTDLDELIGREEGPDRFRYGPIPEAMRRGEELVLEGSAHLSAVMLAKIGLVAENLFLVETEERILPGEGFRLVLV
ncbi:MAG TPA: hypothetical protein PKD29_01630 [Rhodocyclaceae bacterium]|mgnify:CR=1 FL=1|nr:hypothetical protein [Rhodocyclaceae bacterium]